MTSAFRAGQGRLDSPKANGNGGFLIASAKAAVAQLLMALCKGVTASPIITASAVAVSYPMPHFRACAACSFLFLPSAHPLLKPIDFLLKPIEAFASGLTDCR